jgi:dipeptidyl aminopeptidase/acylaminoacyl peptidase
VSRKSYRVKIPGGSGCDLAGIIDLPDPATRLPSNVSPVVVFSHCFTCNKDLKAIVRVSRALAEAGIAVLRYDMTGLGGSGGDFTATNFTTNLADLRAAIRFAATELGTVNALVGHSFGGAASLAVAGEEPRLDDLDRLGAVVTLAAPSDTQHLAVRLARMDPTIERNGRGTVSIGGRRWTIVREMLEDLRRHDLPRIVGRIETPTLLMHSPVDEIVGFDHALRLMGLIQSAPDRSTPVSLISIARADHLLANAAADLPFVASTSAAFIRRYASAE